MRLLSLSLAALMPCRLRSLLLLLVGLACGQFVYAESATPAQGLNVCAWPDTRGISYRLSESGQWVGLDVELAMGFAQGLGLNANFVVSSLSTVANDLSKRRCHVAMFGIPIDQDLAIQLRFSKPTLFSELHGVVHRLGRKVRHWSDVDRPGVVVSVVQNSPHALQIRQLIRHARLEWTSSPVISEYDVESGRADIWLTDVFSATNTRNSKDWVSLIQAPSGFARTLYGFAVARDDDVWAERIDSFVREVKKDGRLLRAAETHGLERWVVTR